MMGELVRLDVDGCVATMVIDRPEVRNALSVELLDAMHARMDEVEGIKGLTCLVITGTGKAFCAGMDLKQVLIDPAVGGSGDPELGHRLLTSLGEFTKRVRVLPAVVIAKVNGAAIGGGCGMTCACDITVSHAETKIGFPEVDLGLCPAVVAPWVVRKLGPGRARRVLLKGGVMSGREGYAVGLVDHLAEDGEGLDALTAALVERLSTGAARALAATKGLLNELDGSLDWSVLTKGARLSADVLATAEAQGRLAAGFSKKDKPRG